MSIADLEFQVVAKGEDESHNFKCRSREAAAAADQ